MTSLKYFIPLVIEGNKRDIQSRFFIKRSGKYNCVIRHFKTFSDILEHHDALSFPLEELMNHNEGPVFFTEDHCIYECTPIKNKKYSITTMTDFSVFYNKPDDDVRPGIWINYCDHAIFPSKFFAEYYNTLSSKNLYLGSPKYDVELNEKEIYEKYKNLKKEEKNALVVFPRRRDLHMVDLDKLYRMLRALGYKVLVKTRGKDPAEDRFKGNYYFEDASWFPHTTMELISISDIVINFGSTTVKELVMLKTPLINFDIKPWGLALKFLYDHDFCRTLDTNFEYEDLKEAVEYLTSNDFDSEFDAAIKKYLFEKGNVSAKILDHCGF